MFNRFSTQLSDHIEHVVISHCDSLRGKFDLNWSSEATIDIVVRDVGRVSLALDASSPISDLSFRNVSVVSVSYHQSALDVKKSQLYIQQIDLKMSLGYGEVEAEEEEEILVRDDDDMLMYIIYGLAGFSGLCLILITGLLIFICKGKHQCLARKNGKKVSRAESWRYESNIFVNPTQRQQQVTSDHQQHSLYHCCHSRLQAYQARNRLQDQDYRTPTSVTHQMLPFQSSPEDHRHQSYHQKSTLTSDKSQDMYTDSSLRYADDTASDYDDQTEISRDDAASSVNTASYSSRNQARTLPINQYGMPSSGFK